MSDSRRWTVRDKIGDLYVVLLLLSTIETGHLDCEIIPPSVVCVLVCIELHPYSWCFLLFRSILKSVIVCSS